MCAKENKNTKIEGNSAQVSTRAEIKTYSLESVMALQRAAELGIEPQESTEDDRKWNTVRSFRSNTRAGEINNFLRRLHRTMDRFEKRLLVLWTRRNKSKRISAV